MCLHHAHKRTHTLHTLHSGDLRGQVYNSYYSNIMTYAAIVIVHNWYCMHVLFTNLFSLYFIQPAIPDTYAVVDMIKVSDTVRY